MFLMLNLTSNSSICKNNFKLESLFQTAQLTFTCSKSTIETIKKKCEISSKLTIKTLDRRQSRRSGAFNVNFQHISHLFLLFLLLALNKYMLAGCNVKMQFIQKDRQKI